MLQTFQDLIRNVLIKGIQIMHRNPRIGVGHIAQLDDFRHLPGQEIDPRGSGSIPCPSAFPFGGIVGH